jgi:hypothetical protein
VRSVQHLRDATIELLGEVFSGQSVPMCYKEGKSIVLVSWEIVAGQ